MAILRDRWVYVGVRFNGPYAQASLRDSSGNRLRAGWSWPFDGDAISRALEPFAAHLRALAEDLPPSREGHPGNDPIPFPVFLDVPREAWAEVQEGPDRNGWPVYRPICRIREVLTGQEDQSKFQFVLFAGRLQRRRTPFALPFDILAIGATASHALAEVRQHTWANLAAVREHGFRTTDVVETDTEHLESALRSTDRDIVITADLAAAIRVCRSVPIHKRPRLILSLEPMHGWDPSDAVPPAGTALVRMQMPEAERLVTELLLAFVHDLPIHEAVKVASRKADHRVTIQVFADPYTNHGLRMRDALIALHTEAERIETRLPSERLDTAVDIILARNPEGRARLDDVADLLKSPAFLQSSAAMSYDALLKMSQDTRAMRNWPNDLDRFSAENQALLPMSSASEGLDRIRRDAARHVTIVRSAIEDPLKRVIEEDRRVIDVALQRLDTSPMLTPVTPGTALAAEALYLLRVHAGRPLQDSLVTGQRREIGSLLPPADDDRGHLLEVVVQAKTFSLESSRQQLLRLPPVGDSEPAYFKIRTPASRGAASLRIHIYYRTHLIQSLLLDAMIRQDEGQGSGERTEVTLAYTRVDRLVLDGVEPRRLSLAANQSGGTHHLILKGIADAGELTLAPTAFDPEVAKFRQTLDDASRDPRNPAQARSYPLLTPGSPPAADVADMIREFAQQGRELYAALFTKVDRSAPKLRAELIALQGSRNQKVQVVRLDDTFVFPWALLYDFVLPAGAGGVEVCLGHVRLADGTVGECSHGPNAGGARTICVNGFWGVRHYVEELLGRGHDTAASVSRPASHAVRIVSDTTLKGAQALQTELKTAIGMQLATGPATEDELIDLLWRQPSERPAILIVLAHMDTTSRPPRIVLAEKQWLTRTGLADRSMSEASPWAQPKPIVLLMACESAMTTASTVNDFVSTLYTAGAAAIVGSEAVVGAEFAARSAARLTTLLWAKHPLGEAMTTIRREVLATGNPLAFVFHAIGSVDLTVH